MKHAIAFGLLLRLALPLARKILDGVIWTIGYQVTSTVWEHLMTFVRRRVK